MSTALKGLGHHLPPSEGRGGVRRPIAVAPGGPSQLAVPAAQAALLQAGILADAVDFIVFATMTPNVTFPGAGCYFQAEMGCQTVGALDIRAQCAGFLYGLVVADRFVRAGVYSNVLVLGAEVHSSGLDYTDLGIDVARLYGDGAGAALFGPSTNTSTILATALHSDGRRHRQFWIEYPASRQHPVRMTVENYRARQHLMTIDVDAVKSFSAQAIPAVADEALAAAGMSRDQIDRFYIANIFPDVAEAAARKLGIAGSKLTNPAARHGHLTAAALPVALSEDVKAGTIDSGATVCLVAAGAGFTWGAAVVRL